MYYLICVYGYPQRYPYKFKRRLWTNGKGEVFGNSQSRDKNRFELNQGIVEHSSYLQKSRLSSGCGIRLGSKLSSICSYWFRWSRRLSCQNLPLSPSQQKLQIKPPYNSRAFVGRMISDVGETNHLKEYSGSVSIGLRGPQEGAWKRIKFFKVWRS